jgi:hypothetical protein
MTIDEEIEYIKNHDALSVEDKKRMIADLQRLKLEAAMCEDGEIDASEF